MSTISAEFPRDIRGKVKAFAIDPKLLAYRMNGRTRINGSV